MTDIKFGTDGWRAVIAKEFTVENVKRISTGSALWMKQQKMKKVVIGYDTRFGGKLFAETAAIVFANHNIECLLSDKFVTTPMLSFACKHFDAGLGVMITASHNPPSYNGYKLKSSFGGPLLSEDLKAVEKMIPPMVDSVDENIEVFIEKDLIRIINLEAKYLETIYEYFDIPALQKMSASIVYDSMLGAGQDCMKKIFPDAKHINDSLNPGFNGIAPEPIAINLIKLEHTIKTNKEYKIGIANDGDADRIGLYNEKGDFVDSHHIMLLLLYYLVEYKSYSGKVVMSVAGSEKIIKLAETYGLEHEITKIGFKHIAPIMLKEKVVMGGEEAGGLAALGHIPDRDGIWIALLILELISASGLSLVELTELMYKKVGRFCYNRYDLKLHEEQKKRIMAKCEEGAFKEFAGRKVARVIDIDGYKFYLGESTWVMIRPSGTEPVLRLYAQAEDHTLLKNLLDETKDFLLSV